MGTQIFLGKPPANIEQWIRDHHGPVVKPETHIKFVDGTEADYLLEGNVDWRYLVSKGLMQQAGGPPTWIKQPKEVTIGSAMTGIGDNAFYYCTKLTSITISNSVKNIWNYVFEGCEDLTSITIGDGLTSIGYDAFHGCSGLTSVTIPDSVTSIGSSTFQGCTGLTSMTFSGKDKATVQGMNNYSWELPSGCIIHCIDGNITL